MPRRCCVPMCRSNYKGESNYTNVFSFPKDETKLAKWLKAIHRKDFVITNSSVVCIKHFDEKFIEREHNVTRPDNSVLIVVPRKSPILSADAYPTIFNGQPSYLTTELASCRATTPDERWKSQERRNEAANQKWFDADRIENFQVFKDGIKKKLFAEKWINFQSLNDITFRKVECVDSPKFIVACQVSSDLHVKIWHNGLLLPISKFEWILGKKGKCSLWSVFDNLLNHLNWYNASSVTIDTKLAVVVNLLEECTQECDDKNLQEKLLFLKEQVYINTQSKIYYSSQMLMWASAFFFSYPAAYSSMRESNKLVLPHPYYLKSLLQHLGSLQSGLSSLQEKYLAAKCRELSNEERNIGLLMDEIYVKVGRYYKGGRIEGIACNTDSSVVAATTLQVFLISSIFSKNKDVGIFPMKNQNADDLHSVLLMVLKMLKTAGYKVIFITADNRVNRKMYEKLGNGQLETSVVNPASTDDEIYLLFDTVHLLKSVRNNWLNQSQSNQTFFIPIMEHLPSSSPLLECSNVFSSISHLKTLYHHEINNTVKLAPSLTRNVLYTSNLERQNVTHAVRIFDDKLIPALESSIDFIGRDVSGTIHFIDIISKWWKIVNVKSPNKGDWLKDAYCQPIKDINDPNLLFLKQFCVWLKTWNMLPPLEFATNCKVGKLSKETFCALYHTMSTFISLCEFLLTKVDPTYVKYVLLGKFQTDCLEACFGQYHGMSDGNYNVSILEILESERKLKIISLLKLKSAKMGNFNIKDFLVLCSDDETTANVLPEDMELFSDVHLLSEDVELNSENRKVLIYISGYVSRVASHSCLDCKGKLTLDSLLQYETTNEDVKMYLGTLDRGGLFWPNDFAVFICTEVYKIFEICIGETYEELFHKVKNVRSLLIALVEEKITS